MGINVKKMEQWTDQARRKLTDHQIQIPIFVNVVPYPRSLWQRTGPLTSGSGLRTPRWRTRGLGNRGVTERV